MENKDHQYILNLLSEIKSIAKLESQQSLDYEENDDDLSGFINSGDYREDEEKNNNNKNIMKSILSSLSLIKIDEIKDDDEEDDSNKEFFKELKNKVVRKMRLNLNDRKRLIELNRLDPKKYSLKNLQRLTGVNAKTMSEWKSNYNEICEQSNLKLCRVKKPVETPVSLFDHEVLKFIDRLREDKKAVTTNMIIAKMIQLKPELKMKVKKTLQKRVYNFLKRNNYSIRKASHIGQPLPSRSLELFLDFFREINRKRHKLGIYDMIGL